MNGGSKMKGVSVRVLCLVVVGVMCLTILPTVGADPTVIRYLDETSTTTVSGETILFNWTGESEAFGTRPDLGYINLQTNFTFEVVDGYDGYGLEVARNYSMSALPSASFYTGHYLYGVVNFSFDLNFKASDNVNYGIKMNLADVMADTTHNRIEFLKGNTTHGRILSQSQSIYVLYDTWHHFAFLTDYDAQTVTAYLDGAQAWTVSATVYAKTVISIEASIAAQNTTLVFDNIAVSVPNYDIQPFQNQDSQMAVALIFDDGNATVYDVAYPMLSAESIVATLAVSTAYIGTLGTLVTWEEIQTLIDGGWGMMSHSVTHISMSSQTESVKRYEFSESLRSIIENTTLNEVRGWIYPGHATNYVTDLIGWEYYSYLGGGTNYDGMPRIQGDCYSDVIGGGSPYGLLYIQRFIPTAVYGHYGAIYPFFHAVLDELNPTYGCNQSAFEYMVDRLTENNTRFVTTDEVAEDARNGLNAIVSGDADGFTISYPTLFGNYTNEEVWIRGDAVYGLGNHVSPENGVMFNYLEGAGTYSQIMHVTPSTYPCYINVTEITPGISWVASHGASYSVTVDDNTGYRVYQDGEVLAAGLGPSFSFTATGGGEFSIEVWYPRTTSSLILLTVDMVAIGIMITVVMSWVMPIAKDVKSGKYSKRPQDLTKEAVKCAVFIIVAILMWVMMKNIVVG